MATKSPDIDPLVLEVAGPSFEEMEALHKAVIGLYNLADQVEFSGLAVRKDGYTAGFSDYPLVGEQWSPFSISITAKPEGPIVCLTRQHITEFENKLWKETHTYFLQDSAEKTKLVVSSQEVNGLSTSPFLKLFLIHTESFSTAHYDALTGVVNDMLICAAKPEEPLHPHLLAG